LQPIPKPNPAQSLGRDPEIKPEAIPIDRSQGSDILLDTHCTQSNKLSKVVKKRPLATVLADIPLLESVVFEPLNTGPEREPQLQLPSDIDIDNEYALFSLFWPEDLWQTISRNTNMYTVIQRVSHPQSKGSRPWFDTSVLEIKVFIATLIYMGLHDSKRTDLYWKSDLESGPIHTPQLYISLKRFEQIKRYLHISQPLGENISEPIDLESASQVPDEYMEKMWWYKVNPLANIFWSAYRKYYIPGTNLAIDELIIRCFGRSTYTYKMPNNPIHQGYKLFAVAEHSYIWDFI
jgi:Transposase IS4